MLPDFRAQIAERDFRLAGVEGRKEKAVRIQRELEETKRVHKEETRQFERKQEKQEFERKQLEERRQMDEKKQAREAEIDALQNQVVDLMTSAMGESWDMLKKSQDSLKRLSQATDDSPFNLSSVENHFHDEAENRFEDEEKTTSETDKLLSDGYQNFSDEQHLLFLRFAMWRNGFKSDGSTAVVSEPMAVSEPLPALSTDNFRGEVSCCRVSADEKNVLEVVKKDFRGEVEESSQDAKRRQS